MDRRKPASPEDTDPKHDDQDSEDGWSIVDPGSGEEAPPPTPNSKRKRVASSAHEFLKSAASPDNLDNLRQIVFDASAGIQNMIPNIDFCGRKRTPPPLPMNYVKTTRPTIYPNAPAVVPAPGNVDRPARKAPRLGIKKDDEIFDWMDQVTRGSTLGESPGPADKEPSQGKTKEDAFPELARLTASEQEFLADSDVTIETLGRGVSDARSGFLSRSASRPAQSPYRHQPGIWTPEHASGGVSSGMFSGSSLDCDAKGNMTAGVLLGYARDSSGARRRDSEKSRRREVLNRLARSDEVFTSDPGLRDLSPHVTPYRKGKRPKASMHDGFYDVDLYADEGSQADDEKETRGRPQKPREK